MNAECGTRNAERTTWPLELRELICFGARKLYVVRTGEVWSFELWLRDRAKRSKRKGGQA